LRFEAWGGSDLAFEECRPRPGDVVAPSETDGPAFSGTFEETLSFSVSRSALCGSRIVFIIVRYRACGEGACRPEATLSLVVPLEIVQLSARLSGLDSR
jgi:hypothetical protein